MAKNIKYYDLPFLEQIKFFIDKLDLPTNKWDDILDKAHNKAFVVAGATNAALLNDMHIALTEAITTGLTINEFKKTFEEIVGKYGWTGWTGETTKSGRAWRANIIYETNIRASYAAGRKLQMEQVKDDRPYMLYRHSDGVLDPRPIHLKWDSLVLPQDHPWWKTHFPPNGFGCKCQAFSLSKDDMQRRGLSVTRDERIPPGNADKGWQYAPQAEWSPDSDAYNSKIKKSMKKFFAKKNKK